MKTIFFEHPKHIFKVWHHHQVFDKIAYRNPEISKKNRTDETLTTEMAQFVQNGKLFISERFSQNEDFQKQNFVFLDLASNQPSYDMLYYKYELTAPNLFFITKKEETLWLSLKTTDPVFEGYPVRESFDVVPLLLHKPVRVCINARWWHGFASRYPTRYYEWDFVYEYLGNFSHCEITEKTVQEEQNLSTLKVIDLRKELY